VFRALWQRIAGLFGKKADEPPPPPPAAEGRRPPLGNIPAPATLVARVAAVQGKDRDMLKLADEAIRRGHPDQAVIAYWKAARVYIQDSQFLKAVSALKQILKFVPDDPEANLALIEAYIELNRTRDAANACLLACDAHAAAGQGDRALAMAHRALHLDPMIKGARERIVALGGELPAAASNEASQPTVPAAAKAPPAAVAKAPTGSGKGLPARSPAAPAPPDPPPSPSPSVDLQELDAQPVELDIQGDLDFPDDSLVLPVPERTPIPADEFESDDSSDPNGLATDEDTGGLELAEHEPDEGAATMLSLEAVSYEEPSIDRSTEADAIDDEEGSATMVATEAQDDAEGDDADGFATMLATAAPDEPATDEIVAAPPEATTDPTNRPFRPKFAIPNQSTSFEPGLPSALVGSEHDPKKIDPKKIDPKKIEMTKPSAGPAGGSTRAYSPDELRALGIKVPKE
jgi:tetratricopeptide (TPR) repeat protein